MSRGLGNIVDEIHQVRAERLDLEQQVKSLKSKQHELELEFLEKAQEQNITSARGQYASSSLSESTLPSVVDWDAFYDFIKRYNYFHLLEKRPSVGGCRELFEKEIDIPGVEAFTKINVNTQRVSK